MEQLSSNSRSLLTHSGELQSSYQIRSVKFREVSYYFVERHLRR